MRDSERTCETIVYRKGKPAMQEANKFLNGVSFTMIFTDPDNRELPIQSFKIGTESFDQALKSGRRLVRNRLLYGR